MLDSGTREPLTRPGTGDFLGTRNRLFEIHITIPGTKPELSQEPEGTRQFLKLVKSADIWSLEDFLPIYQFQMEKNLRK